MTTPAGEGPDRFTGLPPGVHVAPLGRRVVAYLVDNVPTVVLLTLLLGPAAGSVAGTALLGLVLAGWLLLRWQRVATVAASPGDQLTGLQVVRFTDGRPLGWGRVLVRAVVLGLLTVTVLGLLLMLLSLLRHPRQQGWHDLAADAVVIHRRGAAVPAQPAETPAAAASAPPAPVPATPPPAPPVTDPALEETALRPAVRADGSGTSSGWVAVLDDGREVAVPGLVLLGRNPRPEPGEELAGLVRVDDQTRTVSKTHLALDLDGGDGLVVIDRGSTNGSVVTAPDGTRRRCRADERVPVSDRSVVSMGDHWLTVRRG